MWSILCLLISVTYQYTPMAMCHAHKLSKLKNLRIASRFLVILSRHVPRNLGNKKYVFMSYLICWERCHIIENVDTKWAKKFPVMHGSNNTGDIVIIWRFLYLMSSTSYSVHICYCSALCEYVSLRGVLHSGCGRMVKINPSFHFNDMTVTGSF